MIRQTISVAIAVALASACGQSESPAGNTLAKPAVAGDVVDKTAYNREQWLQRADEVATTLEAMEKPKPDKVTHDVLEQLQTSTLWTEDSFQPYDRDRELYLRFSKANIRVVDLLRKKGTRDEVASWIMLTIRVTNSIVVKGGVFLASLPDDGQKEVRNAGLDSVRLGLATSVCGALFASLEAGDTIRDALLAELGAMGFATHSREGLQLIEATFAETMDSSESFTRQSSAYSAFRKSVGTELASRPPADLPRKIYEGLNNTLAAGPSTRLASKGGGFSVEIAPTSFIYRFESKDADGKLSIEHTIENSIGQRNVGARCSETVKRDDLLKRLTSAGLSKRVDKETGWMAVTRDDYAAAIRVMQLTDKKTCMLLIEGPPQQMPNAQQIDAFLSSIQATP